MGDAFRRVGPEQGDNTGFGLARTHGSAQCIRPSAASGGPGVAW